MKERLEQYMVVTHIDGKTRATFFDSKEKADQYKMDAECGMGGYAELYKRDYDEEVSSFCTRKEGKR